MRTRISVAALVLTAGVALLSGCGSTHEDLTPELQNLSQRRIDSSNNVDLVWDTQGRQLWNDISVLTLTDRPSRLSPAPVPH